MWPQSVRLVRFSQRFKPNSFLSCNTIHPCTPSFTPYFGLCSQRTLTSFHSQSIGEKQNVPPTSSFILFQRKPNILIPHFQLSNSFSSTSSIFKAFRSKHNFVPKTPFSRHPSLLVSSPPSLPSSSTSSHPFSLEPLPLRSLSPLVFSLACIPKPPLFLGLAGLIPFIATSICTYLTSSIDFVTFQLLQATYGACILSFLGAVHWGIAMKEDEMTTQPMTSFTTQRYCLSVIPSILAFITLSCPPSIALATQLVGFQMVFLGDWIAWRHHMVPDWYLPLRIWLTSIVTLCLLASLWATPYHALNHDPLSVEISRE